MRAKCAARVNARDGRGDLLARLARSWWTGRICVADALAQRVFMVVACTLVTHSNLFTRPARDLARQEDLPEARRADSDQAISGRAGCTRKVAPKVFATCAKCTMTRHGCASGLHWRYARENTGPCFTLNQIWLGHHGHPRAPLITLDGAPLYADVAGGGWVAHRDQLIRWAVHGCTRPTAKMFTSSSTFDSLAASGFTSHS